mgnify:FL=1|jgi:uncharacterized protein
MKEENYLFNESEIPVIKEGIRLFNDEMYWECHEELEHHWIELNPNPVRYVYWAVLQVAVCLYHVREENILGAQGLLKKAKEKFSKCKEQNILSPKTKDLLLWDQLESLIFSINNDAELSSFGVLKEFKFTPENFWRNG